MGTEDVGVQVILHGESGKTRVYKGEPGTTFSVHVPDDPFWPADEQ